MTWYGTRCNSVLTGRKAGGYGQIDLPNIQCEKKIGHKGLHQHGPETWNDKWGEYWDIAPDYPQGENY